jgi:hypothetical protein
LEKTAAEANSQVRSASDDCDWFTDAGTEGMNVRVHDRELLINRNSDNATQRQLVFFEGVDGVNQRCSAVCLWTCAGIELISGETSALN